MSKPLTIEQITGYFEKHNIDYSVNNPGIDNEKPVIVTNWNNVPQKLTAMVEEHFETDWEDESATCLECSGHIHTTPNHHGDVYRFTLLNDGYICRDCFLNNDENLQEFISYSDDKSDTRAALPWMKDMILKAGFVPLTDVNGDPMAYENGFHHGQTDTPQKVKAAIHAEYGSVEVIICITGTGQFDVDFTAYYRSDVKAE